MRIRAAAKNGEPLDGADARALEGALALTEAERDAAIAERDEAREETLRARQDAMDAGRAHADALITERDAALARAEAAERVVEAVREDVRIGDGNMSTATVAALTAYDNQRGGK